jgi:predicted RNA methylase
VSGSPFATLTTCVLFEDPDAPAAAAGPGCGFLVRALKRVDSEDLLIFDADLPSSGFYRGAILRGGTVEAILDAGVNQSGPHELTVLVPAFGRSGGGTVDLVLVDQFRKASSTVARLPVPPVR